MKKLITLFLITFFAGTALAANPVDIDYNDGIYHIVLKGDKVKKQIQFITSQNLITNKEAHNKAKALLTINAGFFDPNNQKSISYIVNDSQTVEDPLFNDALMTNPVLRQNLSKIINRTEFRILDCDSKLKYEIAQHNASVDFMCSVITSAQGGPQLLPNLRLEEEFFIVKNKEGKVIRESASVLHKTARTLIGIKNIDGKQEAHIFIVTNEHPMDIYEARDLCSSYGLDSAMAFDGGSSTSLNYKKKINVTSTQSSGDTGRALKSFMIVKEK